MEREWSGSGTEMERVWNGSGSVVLELGRQKWMGNGTREPEVIKGSETALNCRGLVPEPGLGRVIDGSQFEVVVIYVGTRNNLLIISRVI